MREKGGMRGGRGEGGGRDERREGGGMRGGRGEGGGRDERRDERGGGREGEGMCQL